MIFELFVLVLLWFYYKRNAIIAVEEPAVVLLRRQLRQETTRWTRLKESLQLAKQDNNITLKKAERMEKELKEKIQTIFAIERELDEVEAKLTPILLEHQSKQNQFKDITNEVEKLRSTFTNNQRDLESKKNHLKKLKEGNRELFKSMVCFLIIFDILQKQILYQLLDACYSNWEDLSKIIPQTSKNEVNLDKKPIGKGASAVVYKGTFKKKTDAAIRKLTPFTLAEQNSAIKEILLSW